MNKLSLTVGIPTYNAEKNIDKLICSLLNQRSENYELQSIVVYSDKSSDRTLEVAKSIKDNLVRVVDASVRGGFATGVRYLIEGSKTNLLLLLNDDIKILDKNFIQRLVQPFIEINDVGLVCGNPQPLKPNTFIEKGLVSRLKASEELSIKVNNGSNIFSCDGKTMMLSSDLYTSIDFPLNIKEMGNVDAYFYFSCLKQKLKYIFVKDAYVYYRNASTFKDYVKWIGRNNTNYFLLKEKFSEIVVDSQYTKPKFLFISTLFKQFVLNPIGMCFVFITEFYILFKQKTFVTNFSPIWDVVSSTKRL